MSKMEDKLEESLPEQKTEENRKNGASPDSGMRSDAGQEEQVSGKEMSNDIVRQEVELYKDQLARLTADFQNYKKRVEKDRQSWIDRAHIDVLLPLLDIVDNFDRAFEDAKKETHQERESAVREHIKGFELIHKLFYTFLTQQKVVPIEQVSVFDPYLHEAVAQVEVPDFRTGDIVQVFQNGFKYKDTVLRTAKVSVAK